MNKTLLELLIDELPVKGGWPDGYSYCAQDRTMTEGILKFYELPPNGPLKIGVNFYWQVSDKTMSEVRIKTGLARNWRTAIITREQYEQALKEKEMQNKTEWNGEGLRQREQYVRLGVLRTGLE